MRRLPRSISLLSVNSTVGGAGRLFVPLPSTRTGVGAQFGTMSWRRFRKEFGVVSPPVLRLKVCEVSNLGAGFDSKIQSPLSSEVVGSLILTISGVMKADVVAAIPLSKAGRLSV